MNVVEIVLVALTVIGLIAMVIHYASDIIAEYVIYIAFVLTCACIFAPASAILKKSKVEKNILISILVSIIPTASLFAYYFLDIKEKLDEILGIIGDLSLIGAGVMLSILGGLAIYYNRHPSSDTRKSP